MMKEDRKLKEVKFVDFGNDGKPKLPEEYWPENGKLKADFLKCMKEKSCASWM